MVDSLSKLERSARMAKIGGRNTSPEIVMRKALHAMGLRFRLHVNELPGKPDIVFPKYKAIIFVHGCFWHRHQGCKIAHIPKSNTNFWVDKFNKNVERDLKVVKLLQELGWRVYIVWECELRSTDLVNDIAKKLVEEIRQ